MLGRLWRCEGALGLVTEQGRNHVTVEYPGQSLGATESNTRKRNNGDNFSFWRQYAKVTVRTIALRQGEDDDRPIDC
jgi:hypothetical protein